MLALVLPWAAGCSPHCKHNVMPSNQADAVIPAIPQLFGRYSSKLTKVDADCYMQTTVDMR